MNGIILHHYPNSPFSEKVRLVLGMKGLCWKSVIVPVMLPKPDVVALTGGYRRTPFMQIGADVYCDSALMCRVIDRISPQPPLYPAASDGIAEIVAQWADSALFWTAVPYTTMQPAGVAHIFAGAAPEFLRAFRDDRAAMTAGMRRASLADAGVQLASYCVRIEALLGDGRDWLLGEHTSIADFAVAQSIWFIRRAPPIAVVLTPYARLLAWYERVQRFGHGESSPMSSEDALEVARTAPSRASVSVAAGQAFDADAEVTVTPTDYGVDPVSGRLVGLDADEVVLVREDPRAGTVQVHFPRIGFQVKAQA